MNTNLPGLTSMQDVIWAQVAAEASRLQSREHPSLPLPVDQSQIIDDFPLLKGGTMPPELHLPWKTIAVPGKYITTPPNLTSPRPVFSDNESSLTSLELLREQMGDPILSPIATTRNSSIDSQNSVLSIESPKSPFSPNKPPMITLNIKPSMRIDIAKIKLPPTHSEEDQRRLEIMESKMLKARETAMIQRERQVEAKRVRLAREEEKQRQLEQDEADDLQIMPDAQTVTGLMDNHTSLCSNFQWLGDLYGCKVYVTNMSEKYLRDTYVTQPVIVSAGQVLPYRDKIRTVYLVPLDSKDCRCELFNSVYVLQNEITKIPSGYIEIPVNSLDSQPEPRSRIMMLTGSKKGGFIAKLSINGQSLPVLQRTDNVPIGINPIPILPSQLTTENLRQFNESTVDTTDEDTKSQGSSVGSSGSKFSMTEEQETSIRRWTRDRYTIDEDSKQVTDVNILYNDYDKILPGMLFKTFCNCMKKIYPQLWKKTTNKQRKSITGYRGFNLRQ